MADNDRVNRGDYRGDFGPEGRDRFDAGRRRGYEGWRRGRVSGGYGSPFDAWRSGAGMSWGFTFGTDEGPPRGRGPKNYQRSDERIHDDVCERLTDDPAVDATEVTVRVHDAEVMLEGTVSSRDQKWRAEDCAAEVIGVRDVVNRLRVA